MRYENNATIIKRELMIRLINLFDSEELVEKVDHIQLEMLPKKQFSLRCCIHKDRSVLNYRIKALLGFSAEDENEYDEIRPLSEYAAEALERESLEGDVLTVIDEGCSSCVTTKYFVTNACKGCMARSCIHNCPKDAITMIDHHAHIDPMKCVNCGRCLDVCPYHAIVYVPVPCEEACPVDAITKDEFGKEKIDYSKCIHCGKCEIDCPFGAIMEKSHIIDVLRALNSGKNVVALMAPATAGQFKESIGTILAMIKAIGFEDVIEVAAGADITSAREAEEFRHKMEAGQRFMTTSCCAAYVDAVEKHIPELKPYISDTKTPMYYTAELAEEEYPGSVKVFLSPCVSKKVEAIRSGKVDFVLTLEELEAFFAARGISSESVQAEELKRVPTKHGRGFPLAGGVAGAVAAFAEGIEIKPVTVNGLSKSGIKELKKFATKECPGNLVEVMSCEGGCIGGPNSIANVKVSGRRILTLKESSPDRGGK